LVLIGGDSNSHIGTERNGFERIHGGHGYGALNVNGEHTLQFAQAYDLAIANSFFQKRESHLITYQSGGHRFQIDFMLVSRRHLRNVTDCKVIPGQTIAAQHQLLILTFRFQNKSCKEKRHHVSKIKWNKLANHSDTFAISCNLGDFTKDDYPTANEMWEDVMGRLKGEARQILGETKGGRSKPVITWWWNEEIEKAVEIKNRLFKVWKSSKLDGDRLAYKKQSKAVRGIIRIAKQKVFDGLYDNRHTKSGQNMIYKMARQRERKARDIEFGGRYVKDKSGRLLTTDDRVLKRWKEYFSELLNNDSPNIILNQPPISCNLVQPIDRSEIIRGLKQMKKSKAGGPDDIPIECWKGLGEEGIDVLQTI